VANSLNAFRGGAVGFIDGLGQFGASLIRVLSPDPPNHDEHTDDNGAEQYHADPDASKRADVIECANRVGDRKEEAEVTEQRSLFELRESIECVNVAARSMRRWSERGKTYRYQIAMSIQKVAPTKPP
jgi:hypothetical protein